MMILIVSYLLIANVYMIRLCSVDFYIDNVSDFSNIFFLNKVLQIPFYFISDYVAKIGTWSTNLQRPRYTQGVHIHLGINISVNSFLLWNYM